MPDNESFARGYLKGYEEGLADAWEELLSLTTKGYSSREIQILAKSRRSSIPQKVALAKKRLSREMEIDLETPPRSMAENATETQKEEEPTAIALLPGGTLVVKDNHLEASLLILRDALAKGVPGLCIMRTPPDTIRSRYNVNCRMVWLTKTECVKEEGCDAAKDDYVSPTDLPRLNTMIKSFVSENKKGMIVLEGLEYLINQNDFKGVLKFLSGIRDQVYLAKASMLIPLDPSVFDARDLKSIELEVQG